MDDLNMMEQQKKMQQMEQQELQKEAANSFRNQEQRMMEGLHQESAEKTSQKQMNSFLSRELGEEFDDKAPFEPEQEAELAHKNFIKRHSQRSRMRKERKKRYEQRARTAWTVHELQKNSAEMLPGVPANPMQMENMPVLGTIRANLGKLTSLAPEERQHAVQMTNNISMLFSTLMSNDIVTSTSELQKKLSPELEGGILQEAAAMKYLLTNAKLSEQDRAAAEAVIQELDAMRQKLVTILEDVRSFNVDHYTYNASVSEILHKFGFGSVLRNAEQQKKFRELENELEPKREEKRKIAIEKELKDEKDMPESKRVLADAARMVKKLRAAGLCSYMQTRNFNREVHNTYQTDTGKRMNIFWYDLPRLDSEGNPLLSDEAKQRSCAQIHKERYGGGVKTPPYNQEISKKYEKRLDELVKQLQTMDFTKEEVMRMSDQEFGKVNGMFAEIENIKTDEPNLYAGLSEKMKNRMPLLSRIGIYNNWLMCYSDRAGALLADAEDSPMQDLKEKEFMKTVEQDMPKELNGEFSLERTMKRIVKDYYESSDAPENPYSMDAMLTKDQLADKWDPRSIEDEKEKFNCTKLMDESSRWMKRFSSEEAITCWEDLKGMLTDDLLQEEITRLQTLKDVVKKSPKWKYPQTIPYLDQLITGLPKLFEKIKGRSYDSFVPGDKLCDIVRYYGMGEVVRTAEEQQAFQKEEDRIYPIRMEKERKREEELIQEEKNLPEEERDKRQYERIANKFKQCSLIGIVSAGEFTNARQYQSKKRASLAAATPLALDSEGNVLLSEREKIVDKEGKKGTIGLYMQHRSSKDPAEQQKASEEYAANLERTVAKLKTMNFTMEELLKMPATEMEELNNTFVEISNLKKDEPQLTNGLNEEMKKKLVLITGDLSDFNAWLVATTGYATKLAGGEHFTPAEKENYFKQIFGIPEEGKLDVKARMQAAFAKWDQITQEYHSQKKNASK